MAKKIGKKYAKSTPASATKREPAFQSGVAAATKAIRKQQKGLVTWTGKRV